MAEPNIDSSFDPVTLLGQSPDWLPNLKRCGCCRKTKPLTEFGTDKNTRSGWKWECLSCTNARKRNQYNSDSALRQKRAERHRLRTYGLTAQQFQTMWDNQGGKCAICVRPLVPGKPTCVDHCHVTGKVRDLLCNSCNIMVGFRESIPATVDDLDAYLRKHRSTC